MANELATRSNTNLPGFQSAEGFELLQRQAKMFTHSTLVPQQFQGEQNMGNAIIALEMATRMNASPLMVMQNLYIVYGNPGWSSKFLMQRLINAVVLKLLNTNQPVKKERTLKVLLLTLAREVQMKLSQALK